MKIEELLVHRVWLENLARRLVTDAATADDAAQETWLAAIRSPPREDRGLRGWLATTLRRKLRDRAARSRARAHRERRAAAPEVLPDIAETAARIEAEQALARTVLDLPEPYREAVLLRWRHGLSAAEIAHRTGTPAATIRSRAHRGLRLLRERLSASHPEGTARLAPLLLPAVATDAPGSGGLFLGGIAMTNLTKAALVAGAALLFTGGSILLWPKDSGAPAESATSPEASRIEKAEAGGAAAPDSGAAAEDPDPENTGAATEEGGPGEKAPPAPPKATQSARAETTRAAGPSRPGPIGTRSPDRTVSVSFDDTLFLEAIDYVSTVTGTNIVITPAAREQITNLRFSLMVEDLPVRSLLELMVRFGGQDLVVDSRPDGIWLIDRR